MRCYSSREEWLSNRKSRIGGSDAAAIIGLNPWKDNVTLWKEKMGLQKPEDISGKAVVQYGNAAEPLIRRLFELDHPDMKVYYKDHNMWTNDTVPFAHASLDGWLMDQNGRKGILEIKTTEIQNKQGWDKWDDRVPDNYFSQLIHYFMVTEFDFAVLVAQIRYWKNGILNKTTREYRFERAEYEADIEYLKSAESNFFVSLESGQQPAMILPEII